MEDWVREEVFFFFLMASKYRMNLYQIAWQTRLTHYEMFTLLEKRFIYKFKYIFVCIFFFSHQIYIFIFIFCFILRLKLHGHIVFLDFQWFWFFIFIFFFWNQSMWGKYSIRSVLDFKVFNLFIVYATTNKNKSFVFLSW